MNTSQNLILRRPKIDDLPEIEDLAKGYENNPLPSKFEHAAVVEGDDIVAFGVVRSNLEAILYCTGTPKEKVEALKQLIRQARTDALCLGFNSLDVLAQDEAFAQVLIKHFGFRRAVGIPLILDLG